MHAGAVGQGVPGSALEAGGWVGADLAAALTGLAHYGEVVEVVGGGAVVLARAVVVGNTSSAAIVADLAITLGHVEEIRDTRAAQGALAGAD